MVGTGALEVLRAHTSVLGEDKSQEIVSSKAHDYFPDSEGLQLANIPTSGGKSYIRLQNFDFKTQQNCLSCINFLCFNKFGFVSCHTPKSGLTYGLELQIVGAKRIPVSGQILTSQEIVIQLKAYCFRKFSDLVGIF